MINEEQKSSTTQHSTNPDRLEDASAICTLLVSTDGMLGSKARITAAADPTPTTLYYIWARSFTGQVAFTPGDLIDKEFARATISTWFNKITVHLDGRVIEMKTPNGWASMKYEYTSPVLSNSLLRWEWRGRWKKKTWICVNAQSVPLARLTGRRWSQEGTGRLEVFGEQNDRQDVRDELVVTGLCIFLWLVMRPRRPYN